MMANDPRFEVFPERTRSADPEHPEPGGVIGFGWRFRAGNGQISAASGEGFTRREDAHRAVVAFAADVGAVAIFGLPDMVEDYRRIFGDDDSTFRERIIDVDD